MLAETPYVRIVTTGRVLAIAIIAAAAIATAKAAMIAARISLKEKTMPCRA